MSDYTPPIDDIQFTLDTVANAANWETQTGFEEAGADLVGAILAEAGKLTRDLIAPTNWEGDQKGAHLTPEGVTTPEEFKAVFEAWIEGGWASLACDPEYGGQGLPGVLALAVSEMVNSANMAFSLCPMLTSGAIEAIHAHGSDEIKAKYLPKMISGEWTGAMNLTEPQAGSDVGAVKAKAEPVGDGSYKISGQKIYITWGEHDQTENTIHLVLARTPGAPAGTKGISMFIVPRYMVADDGSSGASNNVRCVGLEEKLGIHASPTCVMSFGEGGDTIGWLVGAENKGMANMFTMMNHARIGVGLQGTALMERAYQKAVTFASDRVQSARIDDPSRTPSEIIHHPDVRRMLMTIRALTEASRAIIYRNSYALDVAQRSTDADAKFQAGGDADLITPISKGWTTDMGVFAVSEAVQVFGGMGFVEETGIAQLYRDIRIAPIYEGTNGIQALDLAGRKLRQDGGVHWRRMIDEMRSFADDGDNALAAEKAELKAAVEGLSEVAEHLFALPMDRITDMASAAQSYLHLWGRVMGGYKLLAQAQHAEKLLSAGDSRASFLQSKVVTARFYALHLLPAWRGLMPSAMGSAETVMALSVEEFARAG